jgi:DNA-binding MarR family transcriptional regulator
LTIDPMSDRVLRRHLGRLLRDAHARALEEGRKSLPGGRHPRDWGVMAVLDETGPVSQQRLAELMGVNRTIMVGVIDVLEADGLVERTRNPEDRRSYALELTPLGHETFARISPEIMAAEKGFAGALSDAQRLRLAELLRTLVSGDRTLPLPPVLAERIGYLLSAAHRKSHARLEAVLSPFGLDVHGFASLTLLSELGPCSQQRLAEEMGVSGTLVVQVVDALEREGLVERRRNPKDRRANALHLTRKGRETQRAAMAQREATMAELTAAFGEGDEAELRALLRTLVQAS